MFITRAMCGDKSCLVIQMQSAEVSRTVTSSFEWSWTISVTVNEGIQGPESWTQYSSIVTVLFTIHAQQAPVHLTWGLLRVCAECPTPRLNLKFELRPSWNNIRDTFPAGTAQDTTAANDTIFIFGLSVISRKWLNIFIDMYMDKVPLQKLDHKYSRL